MKILVVSNLYPPLYVGGYELHCQIVVDGLRASGHEVSVLTSDYGLCKNDLAPAEKGVERSLRIHGMFGNPWLRIRELENLERHNNEMLRAAIGRFDPALVYVWNMGGLSKSMLFTLQRLKIPTDFCVCDHWIARSGEGDVWLNWWNRKKTSFKQRALHSFWSWSGRRHSCDQFAPTNSIRQFRFPRIHFCSGFIRAFTADAGFEVSHGTVIPPPIRTSLFQGKPHSASEPLTRLLYAGRLHPDKGVMTALRAMARLKIRFPGSLTVCGRGEIAYENELKEFVRDNSLPVAFTSISNPEEMAGLYRTHDALLFPSEWPEPFGMTWAEAMSCGLPVICTRMGGSVEFLRHRENALIYSPGNAEELADCISNLAHDGDLRTKIASAGHCEIRSRLNESTIMGQIENQLRETVTTWQPVAPAVYNS